MGSSSTSPSLKALARLVMERIGQRLRAGVPGVVQSYDENDQTAVVTPAIRARDPQGRPADKSPVKVPVAFYNAGGWVMYGPVETGDTVHLDVLDRFQGVWQREGGIVDQERTEPGRLGNAVARPDLWPHGKTPLPPSGGSFRIARRTGEASITLDKDGRIQVCGASGKALVTVTAAGTIELETDGAPLRLVARDNDNVGISATLDAYFDALAVATGVPNPWTLGPTLAIGQVNASSTTVRSS